MPGMNTAVNRKVRAIQAKKKRPKRPTAKIKQQIQTQQSTGDRANNHTKNNRNDSARTEASVSEKDSAASDDDDEEEDITEVYDSEVFKSDHRFLLETKMHKTDTPYVYGLDFTVQSGRLFDFALLSLLWAAIIALSVMLKRRSARPGGEIYRYNQHQVHTLMSERKRQLRDILNDPVLFEDMESRFGDLTSLLGIVSEWQSEKFHQKKDECVKVGKSVVVPWIRNLNVCLIFGTFCTFKSDFYSVMILLMIFVHLIDNAFLYRAAIGKGAPKIAQSEGLFAAVGIPVIEVV